MKKIFFLSSLLSTLLAADESLLIHSVGQIIYHNNKQFIVTSFEKNEFPSEIKNEYVETIITAERPLLFFGIEFAKDTLRIISKQGNNPNTGTYVNVHNRITTRSYALKSYILGILFVYSLSKSLLAQLVNKI